MLYLVATPIGNLKDITLRALDVLRSSDYILCEDTRHTRILTGHYSIATPLKSYHKFSEASKENEILEDLKNGKTIALVSDAGTPGISDPGTRLVKACVENDLRVCSIPGPCAAIAALSCSGLPTEHFQFFGFLPRKANELKQTLTAILSSPHTTICYESPHRLKAFLKIMHGLDAERKLVIAREITKLYEETLRGTASELLKFWEEKAVKGEIVLLIEGSLKTYDDSWNSLPISEHIEHIETTLNVSRMEAIKLAASQRGLSKREVYNTMHKSKKPSRH